MFKVKLKNNPVKRHSLKFLSFFISIFLWFYVVNTKPIIVEKDVPIDLLLPVSKVIANDLKKEVKVKLKGPRAFIETALKKDLRFRIDLRKQGLKKNQITYLLSESNLDLPIGVSLLEANPKVQNVRLGKKLKKSVAIKLNQIGKISESYKLIKNSLNTKTVEIYGPAQLMKTINMIETQPIDLSNLTGEGQIAIDLVLPSSIQLVEPQKLTFSYNVKATQANLTLKNIKIRFLSSKRVLWSSHKKVALSVLSEVGDNVKLTASDIQVVADIPDGSKGKVSVPLKVKLPDKIHLIRIFPQNIKVKVK